MSSGVEYEKIGEIIERVVRSEGLDLVGWALKGEGARSMLRIVIDRDEGVTHDDCVAVNNQVGTILDVEDLIPDRYTLEITSPGLGKSLTDMKAFQRHQGQVARLRVSEPIDGRTSFKGRVTRVSPASVTLADGQDREFEIPFTQILAANTVQTPPGLRRASEGGGEQ
jgi:ribosome maturation factor RimP